MPQSRRPQVPQPGAAWRRWMPWLGVPLALLVLVLVAQALAQPSSPAPNRSNTHSVGPTVDIVPPATKTPTPAPTPTSWVNVPVAPPVVYTPPKPTVHVLRVVTTVTPLNATTLCMPNDTNSFLIRATITVGNPVGGTVSYRWKTNDGFTSVPLTATFKPGQTTQTVMDTWTLGSMYADGRGKWEQVMVSGPNAVRSNRAAFMYTCPAIISGLQVQAVRVPSNCDGVPPGYDVTATVTVFAPAGGSFTYQWMNKDSTGTYTEEKTIIVPPGQLFAQAVATWHIGDPSGLPNGVTVATGTGTVLSAPVDAGTATGDGTPTPTPSTTPTPTATPTCPPNTTQSPVTVDGLTITGAEAYLSSGDLQYNCSPSNPNNPTFHGKIAVDTSKLTKPATITYQWIRPDGTISTWTDQNGKIQTDHPVTINPGDPSPIPTVDDQWTVPPNPTDGAYGEQIVITAINGQPLATPFTSLYGQYTVLCAPQPAPQTN